MSDQGATRWGGAIRPFLLAQALQQLGCQIKLFGISYHGTTASKQIANFPTYAVSCPYHAGFWRSVKAMQQLLPEIDGDILYAVKLKPSSFGIALLKKVFSQRPLIVDIDDWELSWFGGDHWRYRPRLIQLRNDLLKPEGHLRHPDHPLYLQWMERLVSKADEITVHTQFMQARFGGTYIPNGKDISQFDPEKYDPDVSRQKYGLSPYKVLMFPGAPRPYKGLEDVLIACETLGWPELKLVIVGGSPYDNYDQKLQEKWGDRIIMIPRSPVKMMPEIVSAAHIIVVPQRNHPSAKAQFPLKLTDGMAMAKPILASRVGDIPTILGDTGYLVDPDSPEQIAEKIEQIFANFEQAQARAQLARKRCVEQYSIDTMSAQLDQILGRLA